MGLLSTQVSLGEENHGDITQGNLGS